MTSDLTTKIRAGLVAELRAACVGHPNASIAWPHRVLRQAVDLIEQQAAELDLERRRHQNTRDSRERWKVSTFKEQRRATTAESERDEALAELDRLRKLCTHDDDDICQTLGKALGYPWYKDDQSNFPGATEENGVCVGEHVAASIAAEAAKRLDALAAERDELLREKERLGAEVERVTSDRQYVIGWNDGFAHVNGPLRFPTMLRKMWSGSEVQAWLDAQRIEAAREAAADEGSALTRAETTIASQSESIAVLEAENAKLRDLTVWAYDTLTEINVSNYDHDDVCRLNAASVEVILGLATVAEPRLCNADHALPAALAPIGEE